MQLRLQKARGSSSDGMSLVEQKAVTRHVRRRINWVAITPWVIAVGSLAWATSHKQLPTSVNWQPLANILCALIAFYGALFGVNKAVENYTRQKWWEKRFEAYDKTIDALSTLQHVWHLHRLDEDNRNSSPTPSTYFKERIEAIRPRELEAREHYERILSTSPFLLSQNVIDRIRELRQEVDAISSPADDYRTSAEDYYYDILQAYTRCLADVNRFAVRDLGPDGFQQ